MCISNPGGVCHDSICIQVQRSPPHQLRRVPHKAFDDGNDVSAFFWKISGTKKCHGVSVVVICVELPVFYVNRTLECLTEPARYLPYRVSRIAIFCPAIHDVLSPA